MVQFGVLPVVRLGRVGQGLHVRNLIHPGNVCPFQHRAEFDDVAVLDCGAALASSSINWSRRGRFLRVLEADFGPHLDGPLAMR